MNDQPTIVVPLSPAEVCAVDAICDRFEAAWRSGQSPEVENYLAEVAPAIRPFLEYELTGLMEALRPESASAVHRKSLQPGSTLGEYVIQEAIASGGMGTVYKALHRTMQREVALKVPQAAGVEKRQVVRRFMRELRLAGKLLHPHIVTAFDAGEAAGQPFLAMEFVDGRDLHRLVQEQGPLPSTELIDLALQAACALSFVHQAGIIHRDVKPSNFLLAHSGTLKLLDLGLARAMARPALPDPATDLMARDLTNTGVVLGTANFMSPEQAVGSAEIDARSDIYSLGCTLYFLLSGRSPFAGEQLGARLENVPASLNDLIQRMIARSPADRPQSMDAVVAELEAVKGSPTAPLRKNRRPAQHAAKWIGLALGVLLLIAAVVAWQSLGGGTANTPRDDGTQESISRRVALGAIALGGQVQIRDGEDVESPDLLPPQPFLLGWVDMYPRKKPPIGDADLGFLNGLTDLQQLHLGDTKVTDAGLLKVQQITGLEHLYLTNTAVTSDGLKSLAPLAKLQQLVLQQCAELSDDGLVHLRSLPSLRYLNVTETAIGDKGMRHLGTLTKLVALDARSTQVGDEGVAAIAGLNRLEQLSLATTRITPNAVALIANSFPELMLLSLAGNASIGDEHLEPLAALKKLKELQLEGTTVTKAGADRIQESLPGCNMILTAQ